MAAKVPCRFFAAGNCAFGDGCRFSHDLGGSASGGGGGGGGGAQQAGGAAVCRFFLAGNCAYGAQCRFSHPAGAAASQPPRAPGGPPPQQRARPPAPHAHAHAQPPSGGPGGVFKWPSGADEFGLLESNDPNPNWEEYMDPEEMEAFEEWQQQQQHEGDGGYGEDDYGELLDPSDIPLCGDFETRGACAGGDDCPLVHGDRCEACGRFAIHPYNPEVIEAHKKACSGAKPAGLPAANGGPAAPAANGGGSCGGRAAAGAADAAGAGTAATADGLAGELQRKARLDG